VDVPSYGVQRREALKVFYVTAADLVLELQAEVPELRGKHVIGLHDDQRGAIGDARGELIGDENASPPGFSVLRGHGCLFVDDDVRDELRSGEREDEHDEPEDYD
jgi:hypothetical protein